MSNMLDYMRIFGHLRLRDHGFTAIDNLIYSQLSYLDYAEAEEILPQPLYALGGLVRYGVMDRDNFELFQLAGSLPRFQNSLAFRYVSKFSEAETQQFAAVTFLLDDGTAFVSFRGTDSTLVGWKEDFMLSFTTPVPAQIHAASYLSEVGAFLNCPLRVGGHSKGGNLAIYASAFCKEAVQKRLTAIYSNDGPGFEEVVLQSAGYQRIKPLIHRTLPESSAVGILMNSDSEACVVKSNNMGLHQHNPYSWQVEGDHFVTIPETNLPSNMLSQAQKNWLACLNEEKRRQYTDLVFDLLSASNARTIQELKANPALLINSARAIKALPQEDKAELLAFIKQVLSSLYAGSSAVLKKKYDALVETVKEKIEEAGQQ